MKFRDIISGLESTSELMFQAADNAAWDEVASLDRRRVHLLAAMTAAEEHDLTEQIRGQIDRIMDLDNLVLQIISKAKTAKKQASASSQTRQQVGLQMYSQAP